MEQKRPVEQGTSRLTREQNLTTYKHEQKHLAQGDMYEPNYKEYGGEDT